MSLGSRFCEMSSIGCWAYQNIIARFSMQDSKKGFLPFRHGISLTKDQCPKTPVEIENMKTVPYASAVEASCMLYFALHLTLVLP